jgi:hypothetical protein
VLLVAFLAPMLAAFALAEIVKRQNSAGRIVFPGLNLFALIAAILFWAWRFSLPDDDVHATLLNGLSRAFFLLITGALLFILTREEGKIGLSRIAPLLLILVAWLDVITHEPVQNPTTPPNVYELNLARTKLAMIPQPELGESRVMLAPMAARQFVHSAISSPQNNYLIGRLAYGADCNILDAVPKVDGFLSLMPRECDEFQSLLYDATNADYPRIEDFMGVSQITAPDQIYHWQSRSNFLPLVTAGQKPIFLDDTNTLVALAQNSFDGSKIVFLPPEMKPFVSVSNQTSAKILGSKFGNQTVDIEVEAQEPSLVVVAQTYYHNWRIYMDGQPSPLLRANIAFQAFQVSAGRHHVQLIYEDRVFETGAAISIVAWLGCLLCLLRLRLKKSDKLKNFFSTNGDSQFK